MVGENRFGEKRKIYDVTTKLLLKCMWQKKVMPEDLAKKLDITVHELFYKMYMGNGFEKPETNQIRNILGLSNFEMEQIFIERSNSNES